MSAVQERNTCTRGIYTYKTKPQLARL